MMTETNFWTITISLAAQLQAKQFSATQSCPQKAKQVYLNTLAVTAVNSYLNCIGWATNLENSDSWNSVMHTIMDVADLKIPNYGKLECRFVLSDEEFVTIPPEVWSDRIAYIVVELNNSLTEAKLLGFTTKISQANLPLSQLEALDKLPAYLSQQKRAGITDSRTELSKWLEGIFELDWHRLEDLLLPATTINFRNISVTDNLAEDISRVKLVDLEDPQNSNIALVVNIVNQIEGELNISVKVCPATSHRYLPQGLELVVIDDSKKPVMCAQANDTETIEFCFSAELGEYFGIEVSLDDYIKVENFII